MIIYGKESCIAHQFVFHTVVVTPLAVVPANPPFCTPNTVNLIVPVCPALSNPACTAARAQSLSSVYGLLPHTAPPDVVPVIVLVIISPTVQLGDITLLGAAGSIVHNGDLANTVPFNGPLVIINWNVSAAPDISLVLTVIVPDVDPVGKLLVLPKLTPVIPDPENAVLVPG